MMSLFSSFDLFLYYWELMIFLLILMGGVNFSFFFSSYSMLLKKMIFSNLGSFFNSLTTSNFSKSLDYFIFSGMLFFIFLNISSNFPFFFPLTSQMSVVLGFSLAIWSSLMIFSLLNSLKSQLSHLIPEGSPIVLTLVLFLIELTSMMIRPLTLSIRLVSNILAGHLLVILLSGLVKNFHLGIFLLSMLNLIEMMVSIIQSYILMTLISLYYSEI